MNVLVVGASGATGKQLVNELLNRGYYVKVIIRSTASIPKKWVSNSNLEISKANILDLNEDSLKNLVANCNAVASCLGHNLTWKGVYGKPRKLVTKAIENLCNAIIQNTPENKVKMVLMNSSGNSNRDLKEPIFFAQKIVIGLLRLLLPPHVDNEQAADYLRTRIGQNNDYIEWVAVRPDSLINSDVVTPYTAFKSPIKSAIFNPGKISRINVANFMANLIDDSLLWNKWKGQMPVIYNTSTLTTSK